MMAFRLLSLSGSVTALVLLSGCTVVSTSQWTGMKTQVDSLAEQNRTLTAQLDNLQVHARNTEDKLIRAEQDLALREEQLGLDRKQLANFRNEREQLHHQFQEVVNRRAPLPPEVSSRLAEMSSRYPSLKFDPQTGISKLDTDILFDFGTSELKPGAEKMLGELVEVLKQAEAQDLKIMVVGHTDDKQVAKKPARDRFRNNFHLSTERALAVSEILSRLGLPEERMGVAGFGASQPIAPNLSAADRQKNRRVELFVLAPNVPVVGWAETTPSLY
jgi:chemotaxis protein MotB